MTRNQRNRKNKMMKNNYDIFSNKTMNVIVMEITALLSKRAITNKHQTKKHSL